MKAIKLNKKRINELGTSLADFTNEYFSGRIENNGSNYLLILLDESYLPFIEYAYSNGLLNEDERYAIEKNNNLLDCYIKEVAIEEIHELVDANA